MIKRLVKHGNSLALVIDKSIIDLLDLPQEVVITTDGKRIIISPKRDEDGNTNKKQ